MEDHLHFQMCYEQTIRSLRKARHNVAHGKGAGMKNLVLAFDFLFGCHHQNLSRVFTLDGQTYRVCCDCGARFEYSLINMSVKRRLFMNHKLVHAA
jgi:hypothetical protein